MVYSPNYLDALQLVVADDEGGQPAQVGEDVRGQHGDLVVAQVTADGWNYGTRFKHSVQFRKYFVLDLTVWRAT